MENIDFGILFQGIGTMIESGWFLACARVFLILLGFLLIYLAYIIHSGFISGYQNRYGDNLKPPTNVYHRMTA